MSHYGKHRTDWKHAPNFVVKSYMETVDREIYFQDVRLQMDAKIWGEEFSRHNPPKKVCTELQTVFCTLNAFKSQSFS